MKCIRSALIKKKLLVCELRSYLLTLEAFKSSSAVQCKLFAGAEEELGKATTIHQLLDIVTTKYASFLDYGVYQCIVDSYNIDKGQEELKYPEHLEKYIKKLKISELAMILPELCPSTDDTKMISIKLDVKTTCSLPKIKKVVADILDVRSFTILLKSIEEGCVVVTFCIPTPVADIFTRGKTFTPLEEDEELYSLSVLWLEIDGCKYFKQIPPATEATAGSYSGKDNSLVNFVAGFYL